MGWFTKKPIIKENNPGLLDFFSVFVGWGGRSTSYEECINMSRYEYIAHVKGISLAQFISQVAVYQTAVARFERYAAVQKDIQGIRRLIRECPKRGLSKEVKATLIEHDEFLVEKLAWVKNNTPSPGHNPAQDPNAYSDKAWPTRFGKGDDYVLSPTPVTPELDELKEKLKEIRDFVESASEKSLAEKSIAEEAIIREEEANRIVELEKTRAHEVKRQRWQWEVSNPVQDYARLVAKCATAILTPEQDKALAEELTRVKGLIAQTRTELEEMFKSEYIDEEVKPVPLMDVSEDTKVNAKQFLKHVNYLKDLCGLFPLMRKMK